MARIEYLYICVMFLLLSMSAQAVVNRWVHFYTHSVTDICNNNTAIITQNNVLPVTQLLFCWNALAPKKGYFSFELRLKNKKTNTWDVWMPIGEWGRSAEHRKSQTSSCALAEWVHVRGESKRGVYDAYQIRARAHAGADIRALKTLYVSLCDVKKFNSELLQKWSLSSHTVKNVPMVSQFQVNHAATDKICSPTSCSLVLHYFMKMPCDAAKLADHSFDSGLEAYGSWPYSIAAAYAWGNGSVRAWVTRCNSFVDIHDLLLRNIPVIVSVRGQLEGAPRIYTHGHLLTVIGWDAHAQTVICHDSAMPTHDTVCVAYGIKTFLAGWERSHRLAYVILPEKSI